VANSRMPSTEGFITSNSPDLDFQVSLAPSCLWPSDCVESAAPRAPGVGSLSITTAL